MQFTTIKLPTAWRTEDDHITGNCDTMRYEAPNAREAVKRAASRVRPEDLPCDILVTDGMYTHCYTVEPPTDVLIRES